MTALKLVQNGCIYGIFYQAMLGQALACVQSRQSIHYSRTYTKRVYIYIYIYIYIIFYQSLLRQALECVQSRQSVDYSRPCTKWANIWHFLDKPYHACILVRAFTALTHVQKWVCIWHILSVNAQTRLSMRSVSPEQSLLLALAQNGCTYGIFFQ